MDADGSDARALTHEGVCVRPSWSADGQWIVYTRRDGAPWGLWKLPAAGGTPVQVASGWVFLGRFSPDGSRIGCWEIPPDSLFHPRFMLMAASGGTAQPLRTPYDYKQAGWTWTPDGKGITVQRSDGGASNLVHYPIDGSPPRQLTAFPPGPSIFSWAWLPDGSALVCERGTPKDNVVMLQRPL
jgi:Tol biopolymer transport system component